MTLTLNTHKIDNQATALINRLLAFLILSFTLLVGGCALNSPFPIDAEKTAQALWQVGEVVEEFTSVCMKDGVEEQCCYQRKFLGITPEGHYVAQEFYNDNGKKLSSPYLLSHEKALLLDDPEMGEYILGSFTSWHLNGQKWSTSTLVNGIFEGELLSRAENGQLVIMSNFKNGQMHGLCKQWYPSGAPKGEHLYDDGETIAYIYWDENGKVIDSHGSF